MTANGRAPRAQDARERPRGTGSGGLDAPRCSADNVNMHSHKEAWHGRREDEEGGPPGPDRRGGPRSDLPARGGTAERRGGGAPDRDRPVRRLPAFPEQGGD